MHHRPRASVDTNHQSVPPYPMNHPCAHGVFCLPLKDNLLPERPMANLILILGDQLSQAISAMENADKTSDLLVLVEVQHEASYTYHHKKKLVFIFSAMRHFARGLEAQGWQVHYQAYNPENADQTPEQVVARLAQKHKPD